MADCGLVIGIRGQKHAEGPLRHVEPKVICIKGLKQQRIEAATSLIVSSPATRVCFPCFQYKLWHRP